MTCRSTWDNPNSTWDDGSTYWDSVCLDISAQEPSSSDGFSSTADNIISTSFNCVEISSDIIQSSGWVSLQSSVLLLETAFDSFGSAAVVRQYSDLSAQEQNPDVLECISFSIIESSQNSFEFGDDLLSGVLQSNVIISDFHLYENQLLDICNVQANVSLSISVSIDEQQKDASSILAASKIDADFSSTEYSVDSCIIQSNALSFASFVGNEPFQKDTLLSTSISTISADADADELGEDDLGAFDASLSVSVSSAQLVEKSIPDVVLATGVLLVSASWDSNESPTKDSCSVVSKTNISTALFSSEAPSTDDFSLSANSALSLDISSNETGVDTTELVAKSFIETELSTSEAAGTDEFVSETNSLIISKNFAISELNSDSLLIDGFCSIVSSFVLSETSKDSLSILAYLEQLEIPYNLQTSNITLSSARLSWQYVPNEYVNVFDVKVERKTGENYILSGLFENIPNTFFDAENLDKSSQYRWAVRQKIDINDPTDWTEWQTFWTDQEAVLFANEDTAKDTTYIISSNKIQTDLLSTEDDNVDLISAPLKTLSSGFIFCTESSAEKDLFAAEGITISSGNLFRSEPATKDIFQSSARVFSSGELEIIEEFSTKEFGSASGINDVSCIIAALEQSNDICSINAKSLIEIGISASESSVDTTSIGIALRILGDVDAIEVESLDSFSAVISEESLSIPFNLYSDQITTTTARLSWDYDGLSEVDSNEFVVRISPLFGILFEDGGRLLFEDGTTVVQDYSNSLSLSLESGEDLLLENGEDLLNESSIPDETPVDTFVFYNTKDDYLDIYDLIGSTSYRWSVQRISEIGFSPGWSDWATFWTAKEINFSAGEDSDSDNFEFSFDISIVVSHIDLNEDFSPDSISGSISNSISSYIEASEPTGKDLFDSTAASIVFGKLETFDTGRDGFSSSSNASIIVSDISLSDDGNDQAYVSSIASIRSSVSLSENNLSDQISLIVSSNISGDAAVAENSSPDLLEIETYIIITYVDLSAVESEGLDIFESNVADFWVFDSICSKANISFNLANAEIDLLPDVSPAHNSEISIDLYNESDAEIVPSPVLYVSGFSIIAINYIAPHISPVIDIYQSPVINIDIMHEEDITICPIET